MRDALARSENGASCAYCEPISTASGSGESWDLSPCFAAGSIPQPAYLNIVPLQVVAPQLQAYRASFSNAPKSAREKA